MMSLLMILNKVTATGAVVGLSTLALTLPMSRLAASYPAISTDGDAQMPCGMTVAQQDQWPGMPGRGMYDPSRLETLQGEVLKVETMGNGHMGNGHMGNGHMGHGIHLLVRSGEETIDLHLGPSWYFDNESMEFAPQDQVEVTGTRIDWHGQSAMIVGTITKGNTTLQLRDDNGLPVWMRQGPVPR